MANYSNLIVLDGPNLGPVKDNGSDPSIGTDTWESSLYQRKRGSELETMYIKNQQSVKWE